MRKRGVDRTNAERQRRYIANLKATAAMIDRIKAAAGAPLTESFLDIFVLPESSVPAVRLPMRGFGASGHVVMSVQEAIDIATVLALAAMKNGASLQAGVILPVSDAVRTATQGAEQPSPYTPRARLASAALRSSGTTKSGTRRRKPPA